MKALVFDRSKYSWDDSKGFEKVDVPTPEIEKDDDVIIKVHLINSPFVWIPF